MSFAWYGSLSPQNHQVTLSLEVLGNTSDLGYCADRYYGTGYINHHTLHNSII